MKSQPRVPEPGVFSSQPPPPTDGRQDILDFTVREQSQNVVVGQLDTRSCDLVRVPAGRNRLYRPIVGFHPQEFVHVDRQSLFPQLVRSPFRSVVSGVPIARGKKIEATPIHLWVWGWCEPGDAIATSERRQWRAALPRCRRRQLFHDFIEVEARGFLPRWEFLETAQPFGCEGL